MAGNVKGSLRLRCFIEAMTRTINTDGEDERRILETGRPLLSELVAGDDWLPDFCAQPHQTSYRQYLLHCDPLQRFSVVSFVWGPGQQTPIHNHTVWGLIGLLRGAEIEQSYRCEAGAIVPTTLTRLEPGDIGMVSPTIGDLHKVANAYDDRVSISIHVYGGNIGAIKRSVFDPQTGEQVPFVSGYHNDVIPNVWSSC